MDEDGYYGESVAAGYDAAAACTAGQEVVDATVDVLAELAGDGRALELGIGTGRIALPLAARGVKVHGIDLSRPMVARLRAKPGGDAIDVTIGDFTSTRVPETFSMVFLVFNTLMNLATQEAQLACFHTAAAHLEPGGCFVVEVMMPRLRTWSTDIYDVATQQLPKMRLKVGKDDPEIRFNPNRYVWPAELDLMAQLAGLRPRARWGDWNQGPLTHDSRDQISIWEKPLPDDD